WLLIPLAWLVFSLRQSENLLWGWQLQIPLAALGAVVALAALETGGRWALPVGIGGALLASFSFPAGLGVRAPGLGRVPRPTRVWSCCSARRDGGPPVFFPL